MDIVTSAKMREIDMRAMQEYGIPGIVLMENAGLRVADTINATGKSKSVVILAGPGNNGGDGFVIARHLWRKKHIAVWLAADPKDYRGDALTNLNIMQHLGIPFRQLFESGALSALEDDLSSADLIIDSLLGTGLTRDVSGTLAEVIRMVNNTHTYVISVDIPSGICADSGMVMGEAIRADQTVTFGLPKKGLLMFPGAAFAGKLQVADIGLPPQLLTGNNLKLLMPDAISALIPKRLSDGHKGTFGTVLLMAGSPGMTGAAVLAARSALRGGAGLVTIAVPRGVQPVVAAMVAEATTLPLAENSRGSVQAEALKQLSEKWQNSSVLAAGPGLSIDEDVLEVLEGIILQCPIPVVLDADALTLLAGHSELLRARDKETIMTPHPGEAARLLGCSTSEVQADRMSAVRELASQYHCTAVLKGAHTLIAEQGGEVFLNITGNSGMASGGSGDVLTGLMAALLAQGLTSSAAARVAVYLHGLAGDLAENEKGKEGLIAGDIVEQIPQAYLKIKKINI